jgi:hypothetical protein
MPRSAVLLLLLALCSPFAASLSAGDVLVDTTQQELHGTFAGQPFWARLTPPDKQFGNNRVLQLVYTPPGDADLGGVHLSDCPFLLLDPHLRIVAWNGRDTGTQAVPGAPNGYSITREVSVVEGNDKRIDLQQRTLTGERGWDLRTAPILLALGWRSGTSFSTRALDLFGPRHAEPLVIAWQDAAITIAGVPYTAAPDEQGRLKTLAAADGSVLITVAARSSSTAVP